MQKYKSLEELSNFLCFECRRYFEKTGAPTRCKICEDEITKFYPFDVATLAKSRYLNNMVTLNDLAVFVINNGERWGEQAFAHIEDKPWKAWSYKGEGFEILFKENLTDLFNPQSIYEFIFGEIYDRKYHWRYKTYVYSNDLDQSIEVVSIELGKAHEGEFEASIDFIKTLVKESEVKALDASLSKKPKDAEKKRIKI